MRWCWRAKKEAYRTLVWWKGTCVTLRPCGSASAAALFAQLDICRLSISGVKNGHRLQRRLPNSAVPHRGSITFTLGSTLYCVEFDADTDTIEWCLIR